ncbi:glycosyltransferase (GT2) [Formosa agariphila KMM 3901]|uniref:Glycosyltransferase (GT2) n=1 Tax=Formosa agariphila (strain DSM 15362 / KCTC 12365 / LMG 23005 / KMM 3901 / M-2Alg 35-1) TaxID=1347342 RepID=T2KMA9_FORAG|nr:glycosyltransferase family A protein [Formosa agariphila]CDF80032.1 glycosyltransferase (GT2) [Formosa agariphila KMM 3901]
MNNEKVSIIVPCYKQAHFLDETLESVLLQTYTNWECIIVNDGSPDHTEDVAKVWLTRDPRFSYIKKENGGLPSARNTGVKNCKGNIILALDSDDVLHIDFLIKLVPVLLNDSSLGIVSCYRKFFKYDKTKTFKNFTESGSDYKDIMYGNRLMPSSIYRKECWEEVGGYDEKMIKGFEDWEFWVNITKRGWKFTFVEEFLFYYRRTETSMLLDTMENHEESNISYIFNKHKEIYIENYSQTLDFLLSKTVTYRSSQKRLKSSKEYLIGKIFMKPFKVVKKLFK